MASGTTAKPRATPTKKAPAAKKSPRKKRSASEAMEDEDSGTAGDSIAADTSPSKKARKGAKRIEEEIKEEIKEEITEEITGEITEEIQEEIREEEVVDDEAGLGHTITIKAVKNDKTDIVEEEAIGDEAALSITFRAEEKTNERAIITNNDGKTAGNTAENEMSAESEQVRDENSGAPEISAEILGHLTAHRSLDSSTGPLFLPSAVVTATSLTEAHSQPDLEAVHASAPFGYGKVGLETQDAPTRSRCSTVDSVCNEYEADLAMDQFVEQLDAETRGREVTECEQRQDEKVFVA